VKIRRLQAIRALSMTKSKWLPLMLLALLFSIFFYFRLHHYLSMQTIKVYQAHAQAWTTDNYALATALYLLVYTLLIACAIPCGTIFTLVGGFLFGYIALFYALFSTTFGGMILYLSVRTSIGSYFAKKSTGWVKKLEHGFQKNAFHYLLMLRLVPLFPCWVSNISAGILNIPLQTFLLATVIGITPATFIYVMAGRGLDKLVAMDNAPLLTFLLTPSIFFPLLGLAMLSLFPVIYKSVKKD
jgi:uncharacterized membrane protein YdjX (TVP38/TMEM64 family)